MANRTVELPLNSSTSAGQSCQAVAHCEAYNYINGLEAGRKFVPPRMYRRIDK